tara:strand:- start:467 stop:820 length:354 start_codon:yes stop_codon:yes gene_type:complete
MQKKPKSIAGKFNPEEVDAIEKTCTYLGITKNQLVRDAVSYWLMMAPGIKILEDTHFGKLLESVSRKMKKTKSIDVKYYESTLRNYAKKYGTSEVEQIISKLEKADKNYLTLKKKSQ